MQEVPGREPAEVISEVSVPAAERAGCRPSRFLGIIGLVALCLVVYLPGFFWIPPVDRDESRFAQASRQMFESVALPAAYRDPVRHGGGVLVPMVQDRPRLNKPPLIYWLQASAAGILTGGNPWHDAIWMYRVPSLLAAIGAVLVTWRIGVLVFDARTGRFAAGLLACCPVMVWEAHQARADMVLLAWTVLAQLALWRVYTGAQGGQKGWRWPLVFWAAMAAGIMTKGPITPLVCGLTAVGLSAAMRRWGWIWRLRPITGVLIVAAAVAPWVWLVARQVGWEHYVATIRDEVLGRSMSAKEGHWGPPGYHLILLPVLFWPGSLLTGLGVAMAVRRGFPREQARGAGPAGERTRRASLRERFRRSVEVQAEQEPYLFLLAWIVPAWLVFEVVGTKLPHYTMPMYPAIAILSARAILAADAGVLKVAGRGSRIGLGIWVAIGAAIGCLAPIVVALGGSLSTPIPPLLPIATIVCVLAVAYLLRKAWGELRVGRYTRAAVAGVVVSVWVSVLVLGVVLPAGWSLWISRAMAYGFARMDPQGTRPIAAAGYAEDSLIFLTRGRIQRIGVAEAKEWVQKHPTGLIYAPYEAHLFHEYFEKAPGYDPQARIAWDVAEGYNYSRGRIEGYELYGVKQP